MDETLLKAWQQLIVLFACHIHMLLCSVKTMMMKMVVLMMMMIIGYCVTEGDEIQIE